MNRMTQLLGSSALVALVMGAPVSADVTPQQVWDEFDAYLRAFGYEVSGTEAESGDDLTISDFAIRMDFPEDDGAVSLTADEIVLTDRGDGSVSVAFPATMPIRMNATPEDGEPVDLTVDYSQTGLEMIVSGTPEEMVYNYTAETFGLTLSDLVVDGKQVGRDAARFEVGMDGVEGTSTVSTSEMREISQDLKMEQLTYDAAFDAGITSAEAPDGAQSGQFSGRMEALTFEGSTTLPLEMETEDPATLFAEGLGGQGTFRHSGGSMAFAMTENGKTTTGETSSNSAEIGVALSGDATTYDVRATDMTLNLSSPDLPFPVSAQMAENAFDVTLPLAAAEEPQDMSFGLTLGGFTMSDRLWDIFDPNKTLPRDPATISVDLDGTVTPFVNLFDPEAVAMLEQTGGVPGELNTLTLNDLTVDAVGSKLTGSGDFTFDNSDLETFDGMPAPSGSVTFNLDGGNALLDRLIEMGVLAQQDAMGARMMLSMFAVPGGSEDSLKSTIEVKKNGQILANGQRIR